MFCVTDTHVRLTALFPGLPRSAATRKAKPIWILLEQETVSGSGISWAVCKSAPCSRQITMPEPHHSKFFTGRMPFLPPNQQRQSTEGKALKAHRRSYISTMPCFISSKHTNPKHKANPNPATISNMSTFNHLYSRPCTCSPYFVKMHT